MFMEVEIRGGKGLRHSGVTVEGPAGFPSTETSPEVYVFWGEVSGVVSSGLPGLKIWVFLY